MSAATQLREAAEAIAADAPDVEVPRGLAALREPFDPSQVGKLPKPYSKDAKKGTCEECGKYHGLPAMHLDFVGHGFVTKRLLDVDPEWSWEPFALDERGLPALDKYGNLWIRLTVCGVTRIGVGDGASMKVLIGDALRNAAMRFGVALDLWAHGSEDEKQDDNEKMPDAPAQAGPTPGFRSSVIDAMNALTPAEAKAVRAWLKEEGLPVSPAQMTAEQSEKVCDYILHGLPKVDPAPASVPPGEDETEGEP